MSRTSTFRAKALTFCLIIILFVLLVCPSHRSCLLYFLSYSLLKFVHVYSNMCSQRAGLIPEFAISPVRFHTSVYDCKKRSRSLRGCENIIITLFLLNIWNRRSRVMTYVVIFHCLRSNVVIDVLLCCISNRVRWGSWVLTCQNQFKPSLHFPLLYYSIPLTSRSHFG
jgi:hypothetical protein